MEKTIKYVSIVWESFLLLWTILHICEIHSKNLFLENLFGLLIFFSWIIPLLLLFLIQTKFLRNILLAIYSLLIILSSPIILFVGMLVIDDFIIGNGFRQIFEKEISDNKFFSIYRTPDQGALGGDK